MLAPITRRKFVAIGAQAATLAAASPFWIVEGQAESLKSPYQPAFAKLDQFVEQYMRDMNAPGMTLSLADRSGVQRVTVYGFSDIESKISVAPTDLFEIGSIGKSFTAICLLQLREEGKLNLNKPIIEYLPWFRLESSFPPITTHHLLTHSSGLPASPPVFSSDPLHKHRPAYAPGQHFYYCNIGYELLGHLLWTLDGREIGEAIRQRILLPLGMDQSEPVATLEFRSRIAKSYYPFQNDRPYPRYGRLGQAPATIYTMGSGCVMSTPRDMGIYLQMIANRGQARQGRILTEESFALFSKPYFRDWDPDPAAGYGYGIEVGRLEGHTVLSHTGGTTSFASAMHVDLEEGVAAFASINAMQQYRPEPVTQYAIQLMRAQRTAESLPEMPAPNSPLRIENAADYAAIYRTTDGRTLEVVADRQGLFLVHHGKRVPLETLETLGLQIEAPDIFYVQHPDFSRFVLIFGRANAGDPKSPVVEAGWGSDWFTNSRYAGLHEFPYPKEWNAYTGHYHNENQAIGSIRIVVRKGKLLIEGVIPLQPAGGGHFLLRDVEYSPEWIRFADIVNGKAMRLKLSGEDMWRVMAD
jgi:CubicO group peptidase (beta-lactamase class C family)